MRLSEAIRLGSMLHPQGFGTFVGEIGESGFDHSKIRETCALAAGWEAAGAASHIETAPRDIVGVRGMTPAGAQMVVLEFPPAWGIWLKERAPCPGHCIGGDLPVFAVIAHLNDFHRWTREAIADWIATVEPPEQVDPVRDMRELETVA